MKKTLSIVAATILLGSTAVAPTAFAQNASPAKPVASDTLKSDTTSTTTTTAPATGAKATATVSTTAAPVVYLTQQGTDQVSASNYIGQDVYAAGEKSIGKINDLIMNKDGTVVAAVIGVGGFLGIAEKNVAIPIAKVIVTHDMKEPSKLHLTTMETAETLKNAPEFKSLSDQKS